MISCSFSVRSFFFFLDEAFLLDGRVPSFVDRIVLLFQDLLARRGFQCLAGLGPGRDAQDADRKDLRAEVFRFPAVLHGVQDGPGQGVRVFEDVADGLAGRFLHQDRFRGIRQAPAEEFHGGGDDVRAFSFPAEIRHLRRLAVIADAVGDLALHEDGLEVGGDHVVKGKGFVIGRGG